MYGSDCLIINSPTSSYLAGLSDDFSEMTNYSKINLKKPINYEYLSTLL